MVEPNYEIWARLDTWAWFQCVALACGIEPGNNGYSVRKDNVWNDYGSEVGSRVDTMRQLVLNCANNGTLRNKRGVEGPGGITPSDFISWIDLKQLQYPDALGVAVQKFHPFESPKELREKINKLENQLDAAMAEAHDRATQIEKLRSPEKPTTPKERTSCLKLIAGLLASGSHIRDLNEKWPSGKQVADALARNGIAINETTARKYLDMAESAYKNEELK